jgi:sortase A
MELLHENHKRAAYLMGYNLVNNRAILLGFVLAALAITGMSFALIQQYTTVIDVSVIRAAEALPVPLEPIYPQEVANPSLKRDRVIARRPSSPGVQPRHTLNAKADESPQPTAVETTLEAEKVKFDRPNAKVEPVAAIQFAPEIPKRIVIPSIGLIAPIVPADVEFEKIWGKEFLQWYVPSKFAAGWHTTSAKLGEPGNTVLNGHHNAFGEVFRYLVDLDVGDVVQVESEGYRFSYQITNRMIVPEKYEQLEVRVNNAQWLLPSVDERLTLISCWPYESNTHRLILVATPLSREEIRPLVE